MLEKRLVAPRVGAWIETPKRYLMPWVDISSHPVWVRGLKPLLCQRIFLGFWRRTPCGCVDWNLNDNTISLIRYSRTPCGCVDWNGGWPRKVLIEKPSHPVWVRGLKRTRGGDSRRYILVAPRVGAWIETQECSQRSGCGWSHPVWVRGLKLTMRGHIRK